MHPSAVSEAAEKERKLLASVEEVATFKNRKCWAGVKFEKMKPGTK